MIAEVTANQERAAPYVMLSAMQQLPNKLVGGEQVRIRSLSQKKGTGPMFLISEAILFNKNCLILEDGTDRLPRNVGTELPFYAA
jgi:hypothetical protein